MNVVDWLERHIFNPQRFESSIRKYGADTVSSYGSALLAGIAGAVGTTTAAIVALPAVVVGVSLVNKLDRDYKERNLLDFYRDQIAAVKGEENSARIMIKDLNDFAEGRGAFSKYPPNELLRGELKANDRQFARSVGSHVLAAGLFAVLAFFILPTVTAAVPALAVGLGSVVVFDQLDRIIGGVSGLLFSQQKPVQPDIVALQDSLHKGDRVTPLQVYSLLVKISPELQGRIEQRFDEDYDNLYLSQKKESMMRDATELGLTKLTKALNDGRVEAEDLVLMLGPNPPIRDPQVAARLQQLHEWEAEADAYSLNDAKVIAPAPAKEKPANFAERERTRRAQPTTPSPNLAV